MKRIFLIATILAMGFMPNAAAANDLPTNGMTIAEVVSWLQGQGYQALVVEGQDGKNHVQTTISGAKVGIYMFDCKDERCGSFQFAAGFSTHGKFDVSRMNEWNRDNRWCRGYYDSTNDPWIEYDIDLTPGGTYELLDDEFATYRSSLDRFVKHYGL
jgi:hypothetical protein